MSNNSQDFGLDYLSLADFGVTSLEESAWDPESTTPEGDHIFEITDVRKRTASTGTPQLQVVCRCVESDNKNAVGTRISGFYPLTDRAIGKLARLLKVVGVSLDEKGGFPPKALLGKRFKGTVSVNTYTRKDPMTLEAHQATSSKLQAERPVD